MTNRAKCDLRSASATYELVVNHDLLTDARHRCEDLDWNKPYMELESWISTFNDSLSTAHKVVGDYSIHAAETGAVTASVYKLRGKVVTDMCHPAIYPLIISQIARLKNPYYV